ncbi:hypothetical protein BJX65DRAFT_186153 [Aspergillus insuetus]
MSESKISKICLVPLTSTSSPLSAALVAELGFALAAVQGTRISNNPKSQDEKCKGGNTYVMCKQHSMRSTMDPHDAQRFQPSLALSSSVSWRSESELQLSLEW